MEYIQSLRGLSREDEFAQLTSTRAVINGSRVATEIEAMQLNIQEKDKWRPWKAIPEEEQELLRANSSKLKVWFAYGGGRTIGTFQTEKEAREAMRADFNRKAALGKIDTCNAVEWTIDEVTIFPNPQKGVSSEFPSREFKDIYKIEGEEVELAHFYDESYNEANTGTRKAPEYTGTWH